MKSSVNMAILVLVACHSSIRGEDTSTPENSKRKKQDFYCSACKSMSETIFREMSDVDPNERVQVGSYRVDGHGHQQLKEVPLIETGYHLENIFENLCSKITNIDGQRISGPLRNIYEHACDDILEEHHDQFIDLLLKQSKNISDARSLAELFCLETRAYCQAEQLDELFKPPPPPPPVEEEEEETEETEKSDL